MVVEEIIKYYGGPLEFERMTGLRAENIHHWRKRGKIPFASQYKISLLTNNQLKVSDELLKPTPLVHHLRVCLSLTPATFLWITKKMGGGRSGTNAWVSEIIEKMAEVDSKNKEGKR